MPVIQRTFEFSYSLVERLPFADRILKNRYVTTSKIPLICSLISSGIQMVASYGKVVVVAADTHIDSAFESVSTIKASVLGKALESKDRVSQYASDIVNRYHHEKAEVLTKAKGYKSAISEQITVISEGTAVSDLKNKVTESVKQAPEVVKNLSNRAVSVAKQGLEISIGHEKTETVFKTVKTHTPKFVTSLLSSEITSATEPSPLPVIPCEPVAAHVAAH